MTDFMNSESPMFKSADMSEAYRKGREDAIESLCFHLSKRDACDIPLWCKAERCETDSCNKCINAILYIAVKVKGQTKEQNDDSTC